MIKSWEGNKRGGGGRQEQIWGGVEPGPRWRNFRYLHYATLTAHIKKTSRKHPTKTRQNVLKNPRCALETLSQRTPQLHHKNPQIVPPQKNTQKIPKMYKQPPKKFTNPSPKKYTKLTPLHPPLVRT